jgi:membrane-anchored protein YejM (alkaline phosphatase superfamily)
MIPSLINYRNPSFNMPIISSLIDIPRPVFVSGTANLLPAYRQSLVVSKVLFTPQAIKKHAYEYRVMFREDVLEVYPMLLTRRAADQTYFGYLEFTISRALSEQNYELADKLAAQYQREWDRLKPTGTRLQRPR